MALDLGDAEGLCGLVRDLQPEVVYHLAAQSHVGLSWEQPATTIEANTVGGVNVLEAVRRAAPEARLVWASSCEVYGRALELPVTEEAPLRPASPYAISKAAGDQFAALYAEAHGLQIVRARPFNHVGPGQQPNFLISSLAQQAARARLDGADRLRILIGNPDTRRDYTDVRDVARAYRLLAEPTVAAGVYNISSGRSVSAAENVATVAALLAPIEVEQIVDPARVRAHEVMDHRGSYERLRGATGWQPEIPLRTTIADTIDWWAAELSG